MIRQSNHDLMLNQNILAEKSAAKLEKLKPKKVLTDMNYTNTIQQTLTIENKTEAEIDDMSAPIL